jgi:hypothetical protein
MSLIIGGYMMNPNMHVDMSRANVAIITGTCPSCKKEWKLEVSLAGIKKWGNGACIQDALPELTPAERELLMTGICDPCYQKMFPPEEDI